MFRARCPWADFNFRNLAICRLTRVFVRKLRQRRRQVPQEAVLRHQGYTGTAVSEEFRVYGTPLADLICVSADVGYPE